MFQQADESAGKPGWNDMSLTFDICNGEAEINISPGGVKPVALIFNI